MVRINLPSFIWRAEAKPEMPTKVRGFCALLRKLLDRSFLRKIEQIESERVLKFEFEAKEGIFVLILELFSKGNVILCKAGEIIMPLELQEWKDRTIKRGEKYILPSKKQNLFKIKLADFKKIISESKDTISKTLATTMGLGGKYAEEVCLRSGVDKKNKKVGEVEIKKLFKQLSEMLKQKTEPVVVLKEGEVKDIVPFKLQVYSEFEQKSFETYSKALDSVLSEGIEEEKVTAVQDKFQAKLDKITKKIEMQQKNLKEMLDKSEESQKKGELIYEKYQELQKLLETIKELRKEHSWKEVKVKLKAVKYIKQITEKTGEISLDI